MSTERFKVFVALKIKEQTVYPILAKSMKEERPGLRDLEKRHQKLGLEARTWLARCFATKSDIETIVEAMRVEMCSAPDGKEMRLARCRFEIAKLCSQLEIPDLSDDDMRDDPDYRGQELEQENFDLFRLIRKYIRTQYLGYK